MKVDSIIIINKSGGLIYYKKFDTSSNNSSYIDINEMLVFAGTFHGTYAISSELTPRGIVQQERRVENKSDKILPHISQTSTTSSTKSSTYSQYKLNKVLQGTTFKSPDFINSRITNDINRSGIKSISTDLFEISCYQTLTGLKFLMFTDPNALDTPNTSIGNSTIADLILKRVYCLYSDYVMKNPFYSIEMPIKNQMFDIKLQNMFDSL